MIRCGFERMEIVTGNLGWIEAICGPMFSGKSEELMRRLRRAILLRAGRAEADLAGVYRGGANATIGKDRRLAETGARRHPSNAF